MFVQVDDATKLARRQTPGDDKAGRLTHEKPVSIDRKALAEGFPRAVGGSRQRGLERPLALDETFDAHSSVGVECHGVAVMDEPPCGASGVGDWSRIGGPRPGPIDSAFPQVAVDHRGIALEVCRRAVEVAILNLNPRAVALFEDRQSARADHENLSFVHERGAECGGGERSCPTPTTVIPTLIHQQRLCPGTVGRHRQRVRLDVGAVAEKPTGNWVGTCDSTAAHIAIECRVHIPNLHTALPQPVARCITVAGEKLAVAENDGSAVTTHSWGKKTARVTVGHAVRTCISDARRRLGERAVMDPETCRRIGNDEVAIVGDRQAENVRADTQELGHSIPRPVAPLSIHVHASGRASPVDIAPVVEARHGKHTIVCRNHTAEDAARSLVEAPNRVVPHPTVSRVFPHEHGAGTDGKVAMDGVASPSSEVKRIESSVIDIALVPSKKTAPSGAFSSCTSVREPSSASR